MRYAELKTKWENLVQKGEAGCVFDYEELVPGKFCVHLSDAGGASMASYSMTETTGFFDSSVDALAFFRFIEIPRILDFDSGTNREPYPDIADVYLDRYESKQKDQIDRLLGLLDRSLISRTATPKDLAAICNEFNAAFGETNPEVRILAWGSLVETLTSDYFTEMIIDDTACVTSDEEKNSAELKMLLESGIFDETNNIHLDLARDFLMNHMSA